MDSHHSELSGSLEDYLEVIYGILKENAVARVGDIAQRSGVSPASVTPAMKRLAEKNLITYSKRKYIQLTDQGRSIARRTLARHNLLFRFLSEILGIDEEQAQEDACAMEHFISDTAMDRFAAFFEYLAACPELRFLLKKGFGKCLHNSTSPSSRCTMSVCPLQECPGGGEELSRLIDLQPETHCEISRINADESCRRKLIDSGFLQGARVVLHRQCSGDLPCIVTVEGYPIELPEELARCVLVVRAADTGDDSDA